MNDDNYSNDNWVHVNAYHRDDGTYVSDYWRRIHGNSQFTKGDFSAFNAGLTCDDSMMPPNTFEAVKYIKDKVRKKVEDYYAYDASKKSADCTGDIFSLRYNTHEANAFYKMASPNLGYNMKYAEKNGKLYNSTEDLDDLKLERKIKARLLLEGTGMKDCKVFVSNEDSSISRKIAKSPEISNLIKRDIKYIRELKYFPAVKENIEFSSSDLYNAIHGGNISEAKFDREGNLHLVIEDLYNFNQGRTSTRGMLGERLQREGHLIPYYVKLNVKIPKSELDRY